MHKIWNGVAIALALLFCCAASGQLRVNKSAVADNLHRLAGDPELQSHSNPGCAKEV